MKDLYLILNLSSLSIPFLFSFHPRLKFYRYWKALIPAMAITMLVFIPWDVAFTKNGFWGFNPDYFIGMKIAHLPLEEWLFFICIPYACIFTHYSLLVLYPNLSVSKLQSKWISWALITIMGTILVFNYDKWYTLVNYTLGILLIIVVLNTRPIMLRKFYPTFIVMLIPFFLVNGILTGSFIESEVVWYNNDENLGIRMFTIPVEDSIYAFSMILMNLYFTELLMGYYNKTKEVSPI